MKKTINFIRLSSLVFLLIFGFIKSYGQQNTCSDLSVTDIIYPIGQNQNLKILIHNSSDKMIIYRNIKLRDKQSGQTFLESKCTCLTFPPKSTETIEVDTTEKQFRWKVYTSVNSFPPKHQIAVDINMHNLPNQPGNCENIAWNTSLSNRNIKSDELLPKFYPNPTKGIIQIENIDLDRADISIFNAIGKKVKKYSWSNNKINTENLKAGLYFVQIHYQNKDYSFQFIREQW